jgi:hypothetical protein
MTITMQQLAALGRQEIDATQAAIDDGAAWHLEGSVGRSMAEAIDAGHCRLGHRPSHDYYGSPIPAWWMIRPGSPGSPEHAGLEAPFDRDEAIKVFETHPENFDVWVAAQLELSA